MLRREGQKVNAKRVYRLLRENGLSHHPKARKRRRIGSSKNSCVRLKPTSPNHVWSYDFLFDATDDGRRLKWMPIIDEYTRECIALEVDRSITSTDVILAAGREAVARNAAGMSTPIRYLVDEHVAAAVATGLRKRGIDVVTIGTGRKRARRTVYVGFQVLIRISSP